MTITLQRTSELEPPTSTALTTTNKTTVFTVDANYPQTVELIILCNADTANACTLLLNWNDGTTDYALWNGTVAAGTTEILDIPIRMKTDGKARTLNATAGSANDITVTVIHSAQQKQGFGFVGR